MSDKVQLIKEEIERRIVQAEEFAERAEGANDDSSKLSWDFVATQNKSLLQFIASLPEEPKKQPKFRVGDTIKGPCNNVFQVKEVLDTQYLLHSERGDELNSIEIVDKYSCLEEPVSEDLEEYAKKLAKGAALDKHNLIWMCKKGAEWQKQQMMKDAVDAWVNTYESVTNPYDNQVSFITELSPSKFRNEETAQIIIVKTEQQ